MIDGMRESFFVAALSVGCGGFVGSVFRYCLSLIQVRWEFPMMTFVTNILGAVLIGMIAQAALVFISMPPNFLLFMKTGVCGGFTTFSTFAFETTDLFQSGHTVTALVYAVLSVVSGVLAVFASQFLLH